jgi:hypothetical protein
MARRPRAGTICTYCGIQQATTWDHVFARQFFPESRRNNLPQVPACDACNNAKSAEELYLTAAMPFGGRHSDSSEALALVERRLAGNQRLARELAGGMERDESGRLVVPFDSERLCRLSEWLARGLVAHTWRTPLPSGCQAKALVLTPFGQEAFDSLLAASGEATSGDIGGDTFTYRGLRDPQSPEKTVWQFTLYGGLHFSDASDGPTRIGVLTGSPEFVALIPA